VPKRRGRTRGAFLQQNKEKKLKNEQSPMVYLSLKFWNFAKKNKGNRKKVVLYLSMSWVSHVVHLCIPLIFTILMSDVQKRGVTKENLPYLVSVSFLFVVRCLVGWSLHGPSRLLEENNAFQNRAWYQTHLLGGVLRMPLSWHAEHHSGDTLDKVEKGSSGLFNFSENTFQIVRIVNAMTVSSIVLAVFDPGAMAISLLMIGFAVSIIAFFDKRLAKNYRELNRMENKISEKIKDAVTNITTVVILRIEKQILKSIEAKIWEPYSLFKNTNRINEAKWFLVSLCASSMPWIVLSYYFYKVSLGLSLSIATLYTLYSYTNNVSETFYDFAGFYGDLLKWKARVLNAEELASGFKPMPNDTNGNGNHAWKELSIRNINFSYHEDGTDLRLDNVSIQARRGEKIVLVGKSGSGKSTSLQVFRELYPSQGGDVHLDGKRLDDVLKSISSQMTLVPQDPEIFATTVWENITMGVDYDPELVKRCVEMASFTEVVENLPNKFDSIIGEKGVKLSVGQKQRLALARGLLACQDKTIVLLDEPTSSIDIENETRIYASIFKAFTDKVIISSIHHLHLLPLFDKIYMFDDGQIEASGTFKELLTNCSEFQKIWREYNKHQNTEVG